jgi:hypothetical protein
MVFTPMSEPAGGLDAVVHLISSRVDDEGNWSVCSDELIAALDIDPVLFWRAVHAQRDRIGFMEAVDGFSQDSAGDLVTLLERVAGPQTEGALTRAGLFLPHPLRVELMEQLFSRAERFASAHSPREDELAAMIVFAGSVSDAIGIYFREHVDLDALIDECAGSFAAARGMPAVGALTAARCLRDFVSRHLIEERSLFFSLEKRLHLAARRLGYRDAGVEGTTGEAPESDGRTGVPRVIWAKAVMGLPSAPIAAETLRRRYRELMKRYHPDVNPAGLERCKDINAAYAVLMSGEEKGASEW